MVCCTVILSLASSTQGTNLACSSITGGAERTIGGACCLQTYLGQKNKTKRQPQVQGETLPQKSKVKSDNPWPLYTLAEVHTRMHIHPTHTCTHKLTYTHIHTYTQTHTLIHTLIHTLTHTQSHTHTNLLNLISIKISVYCAGWGDLSIADSGANMIVMHDFHIT